MCYRVAHLLLHDTLVEDEQFWVEMVVEVDDDDEGVMEKAGPRSRSDAQNRASTCLPST